MQELQAEHTKKVRSKITLGYLPSTSPGISETTPISGRKYHPVSLSFLFTLALLVPKSVFYGC